MKVLVKLGGTLLDAPESRDSLAVQLAEARARRVELVVVHGGGKQMTRYLADRGIESRFVGGLRVTTPETLDAVLKVFAGSVNHELVASLNRAGALAVGLSGIDAFLVEAEEMDPALGAVGRVTQSNPALLHLLVGAGYLPVVASVAGDRQGRVYNVNADQMAVACATAFGASRLVFLTDVDGVLDGDRRLRAVLTAEESRGLISGGIATGGMQAKLNAALAALAGGVEQVRIAPGAAPHVLARILEGEEIGTKMRDQQSTGGGFRRVAGGRAATAHGPQGGDARHPADSRPDQQLRRQRRHAAAYGIRNVRGHSRLHRDSVRRKAAGLRRAPLLQPHAGGDPLSGRLRTGENPRRGP